MECGVGGEGELMSGRWCCAGHLGFAVSAIWDVLPRGRSSPHLCSPRTVLLFAPLSGAPATSPCHLGRLFDFCSHEAAQGSKMYL
jgi:hypothetical protein